MIKKILRGRKWLQPLVVGVAGGILSGALMAFFLRMPSSPGWTPYITPPDQPVDITFALPLFYCAETIDGARWCCGYDEVLREDVCSPDRLTADEMRALEVENRLIDRRSHWFTPRLPGKAVEIYHVFVDANPEANGQWSYLLTDDGQVWMWNEWTSSPPGWFFVSLCGISGLVIGLVTYGVGAFGAWVMSRKL